MDRKEIMSICPDGFEESLKEFIDSIEDKVNEVKDKLEINGLGDLHQIEDAKYIIDELSSDLY